MTSKLNLLNTMGKTYKKKYILLENSINSSINKKVYLTNQNFKNGTVIIDPNYYLITNTAGVSVEIEGSTKNIEFILTENIIFNPNSLLSLAKNINNPTANEISKSGRVFPSQFGLYPQMAYGLGFFCAISIYSSNIILNLNGFEIKQSSEHALQQRFYSNIELASIPFLPSQGPHTFGSTIKHADKCIIKDGILGRSSHHSIHGNLATNIILKNITAYDYEVGVTGLNGVRNIYMDNIIGEGHRTDVPILGIFSTARFIWPFLDALETHNSATTLDISGSNLSITDIKNAIEDDLKSVYLAVINPLNGEKTTTLVQHKLYKNDKALVDGNSYGILINQIGVAVHGFPISRQEPSENIYINETIIKNHIGFINEIPALENPSGGHEKDPVGSVFQTQNKSIDNELLTITTDGKYKGNAVANAQLYVSKAIRNNEQFFNGRRASETPCVKRNSISERTLQWAENGTKIQETNINYLFNGDSMFHVNKGLVTCKLDAVVGLYVENCLITNVQNKTTSWPASSNNLENWNPHTNPLLSTEQKNNYTMYSNGLGKSHPNSTYNGSAGHNVRGWSLSSSHNCLLKNCVTRNVKSELGKAIGYDVHQDADNIYLINCSSYNIDGGVAIVTDTDLIELANNRAMKLPRCIGYRAGPKTNMVVFQDCETDGSNSSPITSGTNSIEILSKNANNITT